LIKRQTGAHAVAIRPDVSGDGNAGSSLAIRLPKKAIRKVFAAAVLLVILILVVGFFKVLWIRRK